MQAESCTAESSGPALNPHHTARFLVVGLLYATTEYLSFVFRFVLLSHCVTQAGLSLVLLLLSLPNADTLSYVLYCLKFQATLP